MFIDETWTKTNMVPLRGWAPCGQRLQAKVPHGRWKTMTFLAALRHDRLDAPWLIDGPINGQTFRLYVAKVLLPTLRPGDIVIMDNLGSHKGKAVRRAIRAAGARLFYLPKYSPDLNPTWVPGETLFDWLVAELDVLISLVPSPVRSLAFVGEAVPFVASRPSQFRLERTIFLLLGPSTIATIRIASSLA